VSTATSRLFRPDPGTLDQCEHSHRGRFSAHHVPSSTVIVTVEGEVDATNARVLATYVERQIAGSAQLVLDLEHVDFFGTAGFAALHNVNVICSRHGIRWVLRVGPQVRHLLTVCDPDGCLPLAGQRSVPVPIRRTN
jgi:anti-anti-sigma factor